jgi:bifunctional non-homologous end joining protein LigD
MLATLTGNPPSTANWLHEIKFDGYRLQAQVGDSGTRFYTRRGHDWTPRFHNLAVALGSLPTHAAILDGEVIVPTKEGLSDFGALESELGASRSERLVYYVFDLLYLDGIDLRDAMLIDRKRVLRKLLSSVGPPIAYSEDLQASGPRVLEDACRLGLEGVVSKLANSKYRSDRQSSWIKVTCRKRDTFVVVGIAYKRGKFDGIYLARREGKRLTYAGKVERGFTTQSERQLREEATALVSRNSPLAKEVKKLKATWLKPRLMADVEYRALTGTGLLRHPSFKGLRRDLD